MSLPPPSPPLRPSPPPPPPLVDQLFGGDPKDLTDNDIIFWLKVYSGLAVLMVIAFVVTRPIHAVFNTRLLETKIVHKPPEIPKASGRWIWAWLVPIFYTCEEDLLKSAGLDALIYMKILTCCFQFFLGVTIVAFLTLVPVHLTADGWIQSLEDGDGNFTFVGGAGAACNISTSEGNINTTCFFTSPFTSMSLRRIPQGSPILTYHFFLVYLVIAWGCFLSYNTYKRYTILRHKFLSRVLEPSYMGGSQLDFPWPKRPLKYLFRRFWNNLSGDRPLPGVSLGADGVPSESNVDSDGSERGEADEVAAAELGTAAAAVALARQQEVERKKNMGLVRAPSTKESEARRRRRGRELEEVIIRNAAEAASSAPSFSQGAPSPFAGAASGDLTSAELQMQSPAAAAAAAAVAHPAELRSPAAQAMTMIAAAEREEEEQRGEEGPVMPVAVVESVALGERPSVLSMKMAATRKDTGQECFVPSDLYAVLVTGVPRIAKRREMMERVYSIRAQCSQGPEEPTEGVDESESADPSPAVAPEDVEVSLDDGVGAEGAGDEGQRSSSSASHRRSASASFSVAQGSSNEHSSSQHRRTASSINGAAAASAARSGSRLAIAAYSNIRNSSALSASAREADISRSMSIGISEGEGEGSGVDVVAAVFKEMFPESFRCTVHVHSDREVTKHMRKWDVLQHKLDVAKALEELKGVKPQARVGGFCCCGGTPVDAISHYQAEVALAEEEILRARMEAAQHEAPSTFVLFYDQFSATVAAQSVLHSEDNRFLQTKPSPGPDDINWQTLLHTDRDRNLRRLIALPFLFFIILLPTGFFTASISNLNIVFCNLSNKEGAVEWYCGDPSGPVGDTQFYRLVSSSMLPALLLSVWQAVVMPISFYYLSLFQSSEASKSSMDRLIARYFVLWGVFNVFIGGFLGGLTQLLQLLQDPTNWLDKLGAAMASASNFFIAFVQTQALLTVPLNLMQPHMGVWTYMLARALHKRAGGCCLLTRDIQMTCQSKSIRYGREIPIHLNVFLIGLAYSIVSPAILPYCLGYFSGFWIVRRYQVLYIFERNYESGGLFWPFVFDCFMAFLFVFGLFMAGVLLTWEAPTLAGILLITTPLIIYYFSRHCHKRFNSTAKYMPLEMAKKAPLALVNPDRYTPPCLRDGAAGWHREAQKVWEGYGMPSSSL